MRKLLPILSFLLFSQHCTAQNWNVFTPGTEKYFINSYGYLKGMRIDSVAASGADLHYYPFKTFREAYTSVTGIISDTGGSWLGEDIIKKADGRFLFPNFWQDTIEVRPAASVGESWLFYRDSTSIYYLAEVTSADTMTILGSADSIKRILLTAHDDNGPVLSDSFNNVELIISKNHGFYEVLDMFLFPFHPRDTNEIVQEYYTYSAHMEVSLSGIFYNNFLPGRKSSLFKMFDYSPPVPSGLENWNVGDIREYKDCYYYLSCNDPVYYLDTIVAKTFTGNGVYYYTEGWMAVPDTVVNNIKYYQYTARSDSFFVPDSGGVFDTGLMPEEFNGTAWGEPFPVYSYLSDDSSQCNQGGLYINWWTLSVISFYQYFGVYKKSIGRVKYHYETSNGNYQVDTSLIFSLRNGVPCGALVAPEVYQPVDVVNINRRILNVYPNPADKVVSLNGLKGKYAVRMIDMVGECVKERNGCEGDISIDVSSINDGVYILTVIRDRVEILRNKVVIRH